MTDEQKAEITEYIKKISDAATATENADILDFSIDEVADRVLLYLNREDLPNAVERIVARIVSRIFNQTLNAKASTSTDSAISSLSDNGQTISFSNEVKNYLSSADDNELFTGFTKLLAPYRRVNVVA
jgi:hypothetical protein